MIDISIPSTAKQIQTQKILHQYRNTILGYNLRNTVKFINPTILHTEIVDFVPIKGMQVLQSYGIREEVVFVLPCILKANPRLLGYYRLLMGISEKQFYTSASGLSIFKTLEHTGKIDSFSDEDIESLCKAINSVMDCFLNDINKDYLKEDLNDLPLMTLGVYADGVWRNIIGQQAAMHVFKTIKTIIKETRANITADEEKEISFINKSGERFRVIPSSDPDISVIKEKTNSIKLLCIEIKGGQDVANVHNRAGEAEKSHQKAIQEGWLEKWTLIYLEGLQEAQRNKLLTESPSTDEWFDINEVCARTGKSYDDFRLKLLTLFSL